jgi:hypothetical protein
MEGGATEDEYMFKGTFGETIGSAMRSRNHFHEPLRSWDDAGLWKVTESAVRWAQNRNQIKRKGSWFDGRDTYLAALTSATEKDRNAKFAETFQTLGQLMHLLADQATVLHARDDLHLSAYSFESFIASRSELVTGFVGFDPSILQQPTGDPQAVVPIARLWDTNTYDGADPPGDAPNLPIGLSEFANANFFSIGTIMEKAWVNPDYPLPAIDRLSPGPKSKDARTQQERRYLQKIGDGVAVEHMVLVGTYYEYLYDPPKDYCQLDDTVYRDYATYLLPRAIGYSAGILDYFFRGKVKIEAPDRFAYALATYVEGNTGHFTQVRFKVSNDTDYPNTSEDTDGPGQMWAVVRYRTPLSGNLFENPNANLSSPVYAVSTPQTVALTRDPTEVVFDFTANPIPTNAADVYLNVVWQGRLGQEDGAIMVGAKDLFEPDPLTFGNGTDYDCFNSTLYHVADIGLWPPYDPPNQTKRDLTSDQVQDLFGAFTDYDLYIKTYDLSNPQTATADWFDYSVAQQAAPPTPGPQYSRFVLLQDQPAYGFSWLVTRSVEVPTGIASGPRNFNFAVPANLNDIVVDPVTGLTTRRFAANMVYRGIPTFSVYIMVVEGLTRFQPCVPASFYLPEPFFRVEGTLSAP